MPADDQCDLTLHVSYEYDRAARSENSIEFAGYDQTFELGKQTDDVHVCRGKAVCKEIRRLMRQESKAVETLPLLQRAAGFPFSRPRP